MHKTYFISDLHFGHENVIKFANLCYKHWPEDELTGNIECCNKLWAKPTIPENISDWDNLIVENWNKVVGENDHTYILGDVSIKRVDPIYTWECLNKLNGIIHLVPGNHDNTFLKWCLENKGGLFNGVVQTEHGPVMSVTSSINKAKIIIEMPYLKISVPLSHGKNAGKVCLSHYPIWSFDSCAFDGVLLYGHIHNFYEQINEFHKLLDNMTFSYTNETRKPEAYNVGCMLPWINFTPKTIDELRAAFKAD